jgi:predicted RNA polymerase sigma factor
LKAKILRKLGKNKEAIAVAEKSLALAKTENDRAYIMNNEKLIAEAKAAK